MIVLITGITGFVGSHLAEYYLDNTDYDIYGTVRWRSNKKNIKYIKDGLVLLECDITDPNGVQKTIKETQPDIIHHLAAQSFVPASFKCPKATIDANIVGTLNILEAVIKSECNPVIQIAGSSEEYGTVKVEETPITEDNPLRPLSPYGVSKVACDLLAMQYFYSYGLNVVVTRAFNHTGPRRGEVFVCSDFAKQIIEIMTKKRTVLMHGNLDAIRDFTDVRDMVRAYYLAVHKPNCVGKQLNICGGFGFKISEILYILRDISKFYIPTKLDESRNRPSDVPILIGDCTKFKKKTGWKPKIPIKKTLEDMLLYWGRNVA